MPKISMIFPESITDQLDKRKSFPRDNISEVTRESLDRYFYLLDYARREIEETFTLSELSLICDMCNGTYFESYSLVGGIAADITDTEPEKFTYWKVNKKTIIEKLNALSPLQDAALVDAVERYWAAVSKHETMDQPKPGEILKGEANK
jgi:hypothetical protein